jgi:transposase-like protein
MSTPKRKRQTISIEVKKKIIDASAADSSKSYADLAKEFSDDKITLSKSNIQTILDGKQKVLDAIEKGVGAKRAHLKPEKHADLEMAVLTWFQQIRSQNVAVSGPLLKVLFFFAYIFTFNFRKKLSSWPGSWISMISKQVTVGWKTSKVGTRSSFELNREKLQLLIWKLWRTGNKLFCVML